MTDKCLALSGKLYFFFILQIVNVEHVLQRKTFQVLNQPLHVAFFKRLPNVKWQVK